jgi:hypothetical protein
MRRLWGQFILLVEVIAAAIAVKLVDASEARFRRWSD